MRHCSNPRCKAPIDQAFGTTKAGDWLEMYEGKRKPADVRELCGRCATAAIWLLEVLPELEFGWYQIIGWGTPLLPPPAPSY